MCVETKWIRRTRISIGATVRCSMSLSWLTWRPARIRSCGALLPQTRTSPVGIFISKSSRNPAVSLFDEGAEVQRLLATVVIGGIMSSTFLTLVLLPVLYEWAERKNKALAHES